MAKCANCGEKIGLLSEPYGLSGTGESLCKKCKDIIYEQVLKKEKETFIEDNREGLIASGVTESGLKHIQKYLDFLKSEGRLNGDKVHRYEEPEPKISFEEKLRQLQERAKEIEEKRKTFLSTTGYNFEGYRIKEYLGIATGESTIGTGIFATLSTEFNDLLGTSSSVIGAKLTATQEKAIAKLIDNCILLGANAVIGVEADVMSLSINNMLVATARGTAVVIEKIEE